MRVALVSSVALLFLGSAATALQQANADQLLDEAQRAAKRGDRIHAQQKLNEAKPVINRQTQALRARFAAHEQWDDCIKSNAFRVATQTEGADVLADAVLGMCLDHETSVMTLQTDVDRYIDDLHGQALAAEVEEDMAKWRTVQRQTALAIIVGSRTK